MQSVDYDFLATRGPRVEFTDVIDERDKELKEKCRTQYLLRSRLTNEIEGSGDMLLINHWNEIAKLRKEINDGFTEQREAASGALVEKFSQALAAFEEAITEMTTEEMLTSENHLLRAVGKRVQQGTPKKCRAQKGTSKKNSSK